MTENKRFTIKNERTLQDNLNGKAYVFSWKCDAEEMCNLLNELFNENEQLKQELNDITLNWTQNKHEFDKDELYVKDNNTEINLKNRNLHISVFIPQIKEYFRFNYIVTGRSLEREYNTLKGDDGI